jgi:hypothetical protein
VTLREGGVTLVWDGRQLVNRRAQRLGFEMRQISHSRLEI